MQLKWLKRKVASLGLPLMKLEATLVIINPYQIMLMMYCIGISQMPKELKRKIAAVANECNLAKPLTDTSPILGWKVR